MPAELKATVLANHMIASLSFWHLGATHWTKTYTVNAILLFQIFFAWSAAAVPFFFTLKADPSVAIRALQSLLSESILSHHPWTALSWAKPLKNIVLWDLLSSEVFNFSNDFWLLAKQVKQLSCQDLRRTSFLHTRETCKLAFTYLECEVIFSALPAEFVAAFKIEIRVAFAADLALNIFINLQLKSTVLHFNN
jgi:hypothetical protein